MISHGRVYKFTGARKIDMLLDFAKVGVRLDMDDFPVLGDMVKYDIVYQKCHLCSAFGAGVPFPETSKVTAPRTVASG